MPTPSGEISLNDVRSELQYGANTISMNDTNVRKLAGITTPSSTISMNDLKNKSIVGDPGKDGFASQPSGVTPTFRINWYANGQISTVVNGSSTTNYSDDWAFIRNGTDYGSDYELAILRVSNTGSYAYTDNITLSNPFVTSWNSLGTSRYIEFSRTTDGETSIVYNAKIRESGGTEVANSNFFVTLTRGAF